MSKPQPVRGFRDVLFDETKTFNAVINAGKTVAEIFCYKAIIVPIVENTGIFKKSIGEETDVVAKEIFSFTTKGGDEISLRPEFTAGVVRAFISNNLQEKLPLKLFTFGPLFRYERPQKGRYRQFNQINFERFGEKSPLIDAETILTAYNILTSLNIAEKTTLEINFIGSKETRKTYQKVLIEYLQAFEGQLSSESQVRLHKNPLRILDSKDEADQKILHKAPLLTDFLNSQERDYFNQIQNLLEPYVKFTHNPRLVRGLDYYNDIVFEFKSVLDESGAKSAVIAGGRYDGLVELMGGNHTPAIGFAGGVERLQILLENSNKKVLDVRPIAIFSYSEETQVKLLQISQSFREMGVKTETIQAGNLKKKFKQASEINAIFTIIVEDDNSLTIKNMDLGTQEKLLYNGYLSQEIIKKIIPNL